MCTPFAASPSTFSPAFTISLSVMFPDSTADAEPRMRMAAFWTGLKGLTGRTGLTGDASGASLR